MSASGGVGRFPIVVLCAKSEEVRSLVKVFDESFERIRGVGSEHVQYSVPASNGAVPIMVTTCNGMGHMNAAVRTAQIINSYQPKLIIFAGTAASISPERIQLGDVLIPGNSVNRVYDKISEKGQPDFEKRQVRSEFKEKFFGENMLISQIDASGLDAMARSWVGALQIDSIKLRGSEASEINISGKAYQLREPRVFDDYDIFSCGMVVDSVSYREFIEDIANTHMRKVGIIDMESYGFFSALKASSRGTVGSTTEGVMIRGVSDYAGRKADTETLPEDWKRVSVENAALVAAHLISDIVGAEGGV